MVPDHYNTLDWDRYAYARSNPLKYIDPSGHFVCEDLKCEPPGNKGNSNNNIPIGNVSLSWAGEQLQPLFSTFQQTYAGKTIVDFLIMVLSGEFSGLEDAWIINKALPETLAHAASHWIYINQGEFSQNAILNWLWGMDSARIRARSGDVSYGSAETLATVVVNNMIDALDEWKRLGTYEDGTNWNGIYDPVNLHPYTWGNASLFTIPTGKIESITKPFFMWGAGVSKFYVFSLYDSSFVLNSYRR